MNTLVPQSCCISQYPSHWAKVSRTTFALQRAASARNLMARPSDLLLVVRLLPSATFPLFHAFLSFIVTACGPIPLCLWAHCFFIIYFSLCLQPCVSALAYMHLYLFVSDWMGVLWFLLHQCVSLSLMCPWFHVCVSVCVCLSQSLRGSAFVWVLCVCIPFRLINYIYIYLCLFPIFCVRQRCCYALLGNFTRSFAEFG